MSRRCWFRLILTLFDNLRDIYFETCVTEIHLHRYFDISVYKSSLALAYDKKKKKVTNTANSVTNDRICLVCFTFLWGMKRFVLMIAVTLLSACGLEQVGVGEHSSSDGIWKGPSYGKHYSGTVYAVGLDYPDGYDWRADARKGKVKCSMVMFADGIPVLKIPVGDAYEVSSEISRHRLRDGCLYTDYTDGNTTVIKRDGEAVARFEGAEDILCMEVHGGRVHTLSRQAGGSGFVYRVDGNLVLERPDGTVYPHLDEYADSIRFCFAQQKKTAEGVKISYYQAAEGKVRKIDMPETVTKVWDIKMVSGRPAAVVSTGDVSPVLLYEGKAEAAEYLKRQDVVSCTFCDSDCLCVCVRCRYSGDNLMSDILWTGGNEWTMYRIGRTLSSVHVDAGGLNAAINPMPGRDGIIFSGKAAFVMPPGYGVCAKECMVRKDSILYAGLSSGGDGPPLIWKDGVLDTLRINGPLTCLR